MTARYETFNKRNILLGLAPVAALMMISACTTVKLEGGDKPIEVNLNVKIDQEVRVKLDKEIEDLISDNPDIF
ncbi:MAG: YnbE family lipoprotein [Pseudomonadota bacterium]